LSYTPKLKSVELDASAKFELDLIRAAHMHPHNILKGIISAKERKEKKASSYDRITNKNNIPM
jgi:hypothetical protein